MTAFGRELGRMGITKLGGARPRRAVADTRRAVLRVANGGTVYVSDSDTG